MASPIFTGFLARCNRQVKSGHKFKPLFEIVYLIFQCFISQHRMKTERSIVSDKLKLQIICNMETLIVNEREDKMKVTIFTRNYRIDGVIELFQGARLTDYLAEAGSFIAVTNAEVLDCHNEKVFTTSFLTVHRDNIEIISP